jgi:8-oxo-dGTP diphosphatase
MTSYNLIIVFNEEENKVLMCKRMSEPYLGLYNLVGGKIDEGEAVIDSAYRELFEETGISKEDINLLPFIDFLWHPIDMEMKVFVGKVKSNIKLVEEIHPLEWISVTENFFDMTVFAGEGNIGHMMEIFKSQRKLINL